MNGIECKTEKEKEIALSAVVPVYNSERWLDELFASLLDQGLAQDEYEIICVNDGSTDNSLSILERYASQNPCIRIINQENAKQAAARNAGLRAARGRYVWFVDSDDYIDSGAFKFIASVMDEHEIDELTVGMKKFSDGNGTYEHKDGSFVYKPLKKQPPVASCSGVKVFRRSIIIENNIWWNPELSLCDDVLFIYKFGLFSKKNVALASPSYNYRQRNDSTSHARSNVVFDKHYNSIKLLREEYHKILKNPPYELTKAQRKNLVKRINLCTQTVLYHVAVRADEQTRTEVLNDCKSKGLYPYKHLWWNLKPKISLQRTVYDFIMFFFPNECMYKILSKMLKKKYDKKNG